MKAQRSARAPEVAGGGEHDAARFEARRARRVSIRLRRRRRRRRREGETPRSKSPRVSHAKHSRWRCYRGAHRMSMKGLFVLSAALLGACHSSAITNGAPAPDETEAGGTEGDRVRGDRRRRPRLHDSSRERGVHGRARDQSRRGENRGRLHAHARESRGHARRGGGHPAETAWSGTFNGPRDALFETLRRHVCTAPRVYALAPEGNKIRRRAPS